MADTLSALRSLMSSHSPPLHALVVPSEDYHQVNLINLVNLLLNHQFSLSFQLLILSSNLIFILCDDNCCNLQSEYVSARDKRRAFVSGFTGSAG